MDRFSDLVPPNLQAQSSRCTRAIVEMNYPRRGLKQNRHRIEQIQQRISGSREASPRLQNRNLKSQHRNLKMLVQNLDPLLVSEDLRTFYHPLADNQPSISHPST